MDARKKEWLALPIICVLFLCLPACRQNKKPPAAPPVNTPESMKATIQRSHAFAGIPSASGMEISGNRIYVIGDDSPWLYVLDLATLQQTDPIQLFETGDFASGRIPKALKPDLECLTLLEMNGQVHLAAFGSGSTPRRARGYTIQLPTANQQAAQVRQHDLKQLYAALQADKQLLGGEVLNLEAAATTDDQVLLFQRAATTGPNLVLAFNKAAFSAYLAKPGAALPAYQAIPFRLPQLAGLQSRFSGAVVSGDRLFFTASVENTADAILDGEVMGSFIGWIPLAALQAGAGTRSPHTALVRDKAGKVYKGKVESLVIPGPGGAGPLHALAITDNDQGQSELLELELAL
jgi:hypothetical protein